MAVEDGVWRVAGGGHDVSGEGQEAMGVGFEKVFFEPVWPLWRRPCVVGVKKKV